MIGIILLFLNMVMASDYSDFYNITGKDYIKAFVKDLSGLTSSSIFYSARTLGFGGFSVTYKTNYLFKPSVKNKVFEKNKAVNISFLQVETGLPYRIDTFLMAGGNDGYNVIGGGIKYGLKNVTDEKYGINLALFAYSHMGLYKHFYLVSVGSRLALSMKLSNVFIPFIGGGFDSFKFKIKSHSDPLLVDYALYDKIYTATCGVRLKFGWFNLAAAYEIYNTGRDSFSGSMGIRF